MPELSYGNFTEGEVHEWSVTSDDGQGATQIFNTAGFFPSKPNGGSFIASNCGGYKDNMNINDNLNVHMNSGVDSSLRGGSGDAGSEEERWIWVLDPLTRKLRVPLSQLVHTQATATTGTVPSLCISFLEGRCRHQWCRQAHVLPSAIPQLRYEALNAPTCCRVHEDPHDTSVLTNRFKYIRILNGNNNNTTTGNGENSNSKLGTMNMDTNDLIPTDRVAQTVGLLRFMAHSVLPSRKKQQKQSSPSGERMNNKSGGEIMMEEGEKNSTQNITNDIENDSDEILELPAKLICRLHLAHRCRYLEDCNNIHICREYELQLQPPPQVVSILASVGPATRTITVGDTCYVSTLLSSGEISDEAFSAICKQQRLGILSSSTTTPWNESQSYLPHRSPMLYSTSAPSSHVGTTNGPSPLLLSSGKWTPDNNTTVINSNFTSSGLISFPTRPENGQSGGNSPIMTGTSIPPPPPPPPSGGGGGGGGYSQTNTQTTSRVLRIYDVRPKVTQANTFGGSFSKHNVSGNGGKTNLNGNNGNNSIGGGGGSRHNGNNGSKGTHNNNNNTNNTNSNNNTNINNNAQHNFYGHQQHQQNNNNNNHPNRHAVTMGVNSERKSSGILSSMNSN